MRRAAKIDSNHNAVLDVFRAHGFSVRSTAQLGGDFPDAVVGIFGRNYLLEIKDGPKKKLSEGQQDFAAEWKGHVRTVRSIEEAQQLAYAWRMVG